MWKQGRVIHGIDGEGTLGWMAFSVWGERDFQIYGVQESPLPSSAKCSMSKVSNFIFHCEPVALDVPWEIITSRDEYNRFFYRRQNVVSVKCFKQVHEESVPMIKHRQGRDACPLTRVTITVYKFSTEIIYKDDIWLLFLGSHYWFCSASIFNKSVRFLPGEDYWGLHENLFDISIHKCTTYCTQHYMYVYTLFVSIHLQYCTPHNI